MRLRQTGARTVVFDVAGTIFLNRPLRITNGDLTIALDKRLPGQGICIARRPVTINATMLLFVMYGFVSAMKVVENPTDLEVPIARMLL